ncbi:MAG: hypothetical protein NBV67_04240 [Tagaea sp.]|nr:hypothetical protein [Tagaea sp.]
MNEASLDAVEGAALARRIDAARAKTAAWLASMRAPGQPAGVLRISPAHDPGRWPGVLLPGTYNGVLCADLIGALPEIGIAAPEHRSVLVAWLETFRRRDGVFRIPEMRDEDVFKKPDPAETWRYIDFHVTNYTLAAIEAVAPDRAPALDFALPYLDPLRLKAWLADRDLRDPWQEGNNIVNLAGFLLAAERHHGAKIGHALDILFDWHDRLQEPSTGFWGVGQHADPLRLLHAMAGSMHNYHIWYARGRTPPYFDKAIGYCLSLPPRVDSACIDVDIVDVLIHGLRAGLAPEVQTRAWLRAIVDAILDAQNSDGGFADVARGTRRQDGWVRGYEEPQGLSNTFATWFRWIAIAMAAEVLAPSARDWRFRRSIGIGYRAPPP